MRRPISLLLALCAVAFTACGDDGGGADSPLDEALGYLPEDAPLVVAVDTDVEGDQFKALEAIAKKFPFGGQIRDQLLQQLQLGGGSFEEDVKPILGNPFVVGGTNVRSVVDDREDDDFVAAIEAQDKGALENAIEKEGAKRTGEKDGADLYEDSDGDTFAIEDDVLVVAGSTQLLESALEQRDADDRLTEETFEEGLADLPSEALVRVYGDMAALIDNDPDTEQARRVSWVDALDTFGLTTTVEEDRLAIEFNLATEGDLSNDDLPLATGGEAPGVIRREGEFGVGLRGADQVIEFAQEAAQAVNPSEYAEYETAKRQISERLDVDLEEDVFAQLTGDVSVSFDVRGAYGGRAELEDPEAFRETLSKASDVLPEVAQGAAGGAAPPRLEKPRGGEGLYRLIQPGSDTIAFGVLNDVLVVTNAPARAQQLAQADPEDVPDAQGALVATVNAEELAQEVLSQLQGIEAIGGRLFTGPLGNLTSSAEASTDGVRGTITLGIDD